PAFEQLHLVAHAVLADPAHSAQRPLDQDGALAHAHDEELPPPLLGLLGPHVVVLAGGVERLGGALDVAIPHRAAGSEAALLQHLAALHATEAQDDDPSRGDGLRRRRRTPALRVPDERAEDDPTHSHDETTPEYT